MSSWPCMVGENAPEIHLYLQLYFHSSCTVFILDWPSCLTGVGFDGFGDLPLIGRIFGQLQLIFAQLSTMSSTDDLPRLSRSFKSLKTPTS